MVEEERKERKEKGGGRMGWKNEGKNGRKQGRKEPGGKKYTVSIFLNP